MVKNFRTPRQLIQLDEVVRSLSPTRSLKDVKEVRDKTEAARHYAQSAALGFKIQNHAAELKMRAERSAGELLAELVVQGGDRKSSSQVENLKLLDLGIERNQLSLWQREAAATEKVFEDYLKTANRMGQETLLVDCCGLNDLWSRSATTFCSERAMAADFTPQEMVLPEL